tara:strand:+ start:390 stop:536 length:147 start_codon:yes stop_codon:yes gene_type:complete
MVRIAPDIIPGPIEPKLPILASIIIAPEAKKTKAKVPKNSQKYLTIFS